MNIDLKNQIRLTISQIFFLSEMCSILTKTTVNYLIANLKIYIAFLNATKSGTYEVYKYEAH